MSLRWLGDHKGSPLRAVVGEGDRGGYGAGFPPLAGEMSEGQRERAAVATLAPPLWVPAFAEMTERVINPEY